MVAIKDVEMPKNCATCYISETVCEHKKTAFVRYSREDFTIPSDCPLVEIIACKDCEYCRYCRGDAVEGIEYLWCEKDSCAVSEDYYCTRAERRK